MKEQYRNGSFGAFLAMCNRRGLSPAQWITKNKVASYDALVKKLRSMNVSPPSKQEWRELIGIDQWADDPPVQQPKPKAEPKPEPKPEPKAEPKAEPKPEPKPKAQPKPKRDDGLVVDENGFVVSVASPKANPKVISQFKPKD